MFFDTTISYFKLLYNDNVICKHFQLQKPKWTLAGRHGQRGIIAVILVTLGASQDQEYVMALQNMEVSIIASEVIQIQEIAPQTRFQVIYYLF